MQIIKMYGTNVKEKKKKNVSQVPELIGVYNFFPPTKTYFAADITARGYSLMT